MFKAKYFPNCLIWEVQEEPNISLLWGSLFWGQEILAKGSCWRIDKGNRVTIYYSKWIHVPSSSKSSSPWVHDNNTFVESLILGNS